MSPRLIALTIFVLLSIASQQCSAEKPSVGERLFALKVQPLFQAKCLGCHGGDATKGLEGQFDIRSRKSLLRGGESFGDSVVVPGKIDESELLAIIRREYEGLEMPPKESERLTQEEVWAVRDWIREGAPWPDEKRVAEIYRDYAEGVTVKTSGGLSDDWTHRKYDPEDLWAFRPIRTRFDDVLDGSTRNPVDVFIERELAERQLTPAPPADRRTLIRRATFDLLGLPPTPEDVQAFVKDPRTDDAAYAALVDRLLESPHYGEQWGRRWLDVVRYADSSGFANDYERPNTWRYRDYVVRAFNADKPFDRFLTEQLAGDELVEQAKRSGTPLSPEEVSELHIAAGFLRMGPWEHTGMSVAKVTRQQFLDDVTDTVGQVFLGQALQCCRCHDHKFDPIPTRDFYSFQAVFASTQFAEVDADWLPSENLGGLEAERDLLKLRRDENGKMLRAANRQRSDLYQKWFEERGLPYKSVGEAKKAGEKKENIPSPTVLPPEVFGLERIGRKWNNRFKWELDRFEPIAYSVYSGRTIYPNSNYNRIRKSTDPKRGSVPETKILTGGDPFSPGQEVRPGVLSAVPGALEFNVPASLSGRRLALAEWMIDPDNTLTSRVIANRVWAGHFGQGIAGNPNNFGATGKKPTHPDLLDWLAQDLRQNGWSLKHLHRRIMLSETYRRSTRHPEPGRVVEVDPEQTSYAVFLPRRLEAEEIRDAMLHVSGELNDSVGGLPIRPDMNLEAALQPRMIMGTFAPSWIPNAKPEQRNRRSLYVLKLRGQRMPFMETFNQPGSEVSCELRDSSNITPQVFSLLNGQETADRALALAIRLTKYSKTDEEAIRRLFQLAFGRTPTPSEIAASLAHWKRMQERQETLEPKPIEMPLTVTREANEENTGEPFTFTETLHDYRNYEPDPQPHQFDAKTRGLADLCLVILNTNEFLFVY